MPSEVQQALKTNAIGYRDQMSTQALARGKGALDKFVAAGGKVRVLSAEERQAWAKSMPNVAKEWAESLEAKGIPGKKILAAYMDKMRAANQQIMRHWDKE